jgi:hypothetical protein
MAKQALASGHPFLSRALAALGSWSSERPRTVGLPATLRLLLAPGQMRNVPHSHAFPECEGRRA